MIIKRLSIAILLLLAPFVASADLITYEYTGPALPAVEGVPVGVTGINATFTVDLPGTNNDTLLSFPLLDYDVTDGLSFFTELSTDYLVTASLFLTNIDAEITSFYLQVFWHPFNTVDHPWTVGSAGYMEVQHNWFGVDSSVVTYCTTEGPDGTCFGIASTGSLEAGSLTTVGVPEPGTLALLATGLLTLGFRRRSVTTREA